MTWQQRARQRQKELGLSHYDLASRIGVLPSRLSNWLSGVRDPGVDYFAAIVTALETSADWLLFGKENQMSWFDEFDERQRKEIDFATTYAQQYAHGTDGHHRLLIIAKMAELLDAGYGKLVAVKPPPIDPTKPVDISRKPAGMT